MSTRCRWAAGALGAVTLGEVALIYLGRTYGSTEREPFPRRLTVASASVSVNPGDLHR